MQLPRRRREDAAARVGAAPQALDAPFGAEQPVRVSRRRSSAAGHRRGAGCACAGRRRRSGRLAARSERDRVAVEVVDRRPCRRCSRRSCSAPSTSACSSSVCGCTMSSATSRSSSSGRARSRCRATGSGEVERAALLDLAASSLAEPEVERAGCSGSPLPPPVATKSAAAISRPANATSTTAITRMRRSEGAAGIAAILVQRCADRPGACRVPAHRSRSWCALSARRPRACAHAATLPRRHRQARPRRTRSGRQGHRPGAARRRVRGRSTPGCSRRPEQVAEAALQEDADAVGLSVLSGAHMTLFPQVVDELREPGPRRRARLRRAASSPTTTSPTLEAAGVAGCSRPARRSPTITEWLEQTLDAREAPSPADRVTDPSGPRSRSPVDLFEYQGKQLFARYGIPVSAGEVASTTVDDAVAAAERVGLSGRRQGAGAGGRARQGRRRQARDQRRRGPRRTRRTSSAWTSRATSSDVVWIEHATDIAEEYYASFTLDRAAKKHLGMLSAQGGVEIEHGRRGEPRRDRARSRSTRSTG